MHPRIHAHTCTHPLTNPHLPSHYAPIPSQRSLIGISVRDTVGSFYEDPTLHALEKRVTMQRSAGSGPGKIGSGARQILRSLCSLLSAYIHLSPRWRHGHISAFFDGHKYVSEPQSEQHTVGVEVTFEDASVQVYANRVLLRGMPFHSIAHSVLHPVLHHIIPLTPHRTSLSRHTYLSCTLLDPREASRAPRGPPMWSEPKASLMLGQPVVVYEVDADMAACLCARVAGVPLALPMGYVQCRSVLDDLLDFVDDDHDDTRNGDGHRGFDVDSALQVSSHRHPLNYAVINPHLSRVLSLISSLTHPPILSKTLSYPHTPSDSPTLVYLGGRFGSRIRANQSAQLDSSNLQISRKICQSL